MSKTIISLIVIVAGLVGLGDVFLPEEVATVVNAGLQIAGIAGAWYGRIVASGKVNWLGFRE